MIRNIFISLIISLFYGCSAVGVPSTSDPYEKLQLAEDLIKRQARPLPVERLIRDAVEICQEIKDSKCLGYAYYTYSLFFKSPSIEGAGKHYRNNGFLDKTVTYDTRLSKSQEYFEKAAPLEPRVFNWRGTVYFEDGQLDLALADFNKAISVAPENKWPYINRGVIYHERGQLDKAISDYNKAISLKSDFAKAFNNRGNTFHAKGQFDKALADFDKAISLENSDFRTYQNRGITFFLLKRFKHAVKDFERASQLNSNDAYPLIWLYLSERRQGKEGIKSLKARSQTLDLRQWPGPIISLYLRNATFEEVIEKTAASSKRWETAKKCTAYFHMGQYYLLQENKKQALVMFRKATNTGFNVFESRAAKEEINRLR